jgi:putative transposase
MPRRPRSSTTGLIFHVVNRSAKRSRLFEDAADYHAFEAILRMATIRFGVAVFAYSIMPNHWHIVLTPLRDGELSRFMHWLTTTHTRRWQLAHGTEGEGAVYQGRFRAIPVAGDAHFLWVCRYVERNALRANLVDRAEDWRWSSLRLRAEINPQWLAEWPAIRPREWVREVNEPQTAAEMEAFRGAMRRGEPYADEPIRRTIECRLGIRKGRQRGRRAGSRGTVLIK